MSFSVVQHGAIFPGTSSSSQAITLTNPVGSGNAIALFGVSEFGNTLTVSDDKSNAYNTIGTISDVTDDIVASSFLLGNITNGPQTFTLHFASGSAFGGGIWIAEISGALNVSNPIDGHNEQLQVSVGTGTDAITSGSFSPTTAAFVIGQTSITNASITANTGTGFSNVDNLATIGRSESLTLGASGATAVTFTSPSAGGNWVTLGIGIKPFVISDTLFISGGIHFI